MTRKMGQKLLFAFATIILAAAPLMPAEAALGPIIDTRVDALEVQVGNLDTQVGNLDTQMGNLDSRVGSLDSRLNRVGAMAAAMSSMPSLPYDAASPTQLLFAAGSYEGKQALAAGVSYFANDSLVWNLSFAVSGGERMGRLGAAWKIGQGGKKAVAAPQGGADNALAAKVEQQQAQIRELQVQNARLQEQLDRLAQLVAAGRGQ